MNRRKFIRNTGAATLMFGGFPIKMLAGNEDLKKIAAASENNNVLIFVQLHGGNDGLNTVIPVSQYNSYYDLRPNIAIPDHGARKFIMVDETVPLESQVGLHPDMTGFKVLYDQGKGTIVQNVGYENMNLSHFRGRDIVFMGGGAEDNYSSGWMGRFLDYEYPGYPEAYNDPNTTTMPDPIGIEMGNAQSLAFHRESGIPIGFNVQSPQQFYDLITKVGTDINLVISDTDSHARDELEFLLDFEGQSNVYAERLKTVYDAGHNTPTVDYPETYPLNADPRFVNNPLSGQLKLIARLLSGGIKTRIFMVRIGGFDTHADQAEKSDPTMGGHAALLYHLSAAIRAFQDDLAGLGLEEKVLTMTFTEFGRRAYSNASYGTDHGTATPVFLFGSGLKGGVYGTNPDLSDLKGGNIKYAIDYRQVYTSVVQDWFGASDEAMVATKFDGWIDKKLDLIKGTTGRDVHYRDSGNMLLYDCYPNPVKDFCNFSFYLSKPGRATIRLFDSAGKQIMVITDGNYVFGKSKVMADLSGLPKGTYVYQFSSGGVTTNKRLVLQ